MYLMQLTLLSLSLVASATAVPTVLGVQFDDQGDDCCQLEWLPLIERGTKRFIPSSALSVATKNGTQWFYFMKAGGARFGVISDEVERLPIFLEAPVGEGPWRGGYVLSNPHNCITGYLTVRRGQALRETVKRQFPSVNDKYFGATQDNYIGFAYKSGVNQYGGGFLGFNEGKFSSKDDYHWYEFLYVDCQASLKSHLTAELFDMDINVDKLMATHDHEAVAVTEMVNESDNNQTANVDLTADINCALEMEHETHLETVATTKWAVRASSTLNFVSGLLSLGVKRENERHDLKEQFARNGSIRFDSKKIIYKFKHSLDMQPHTRTKVAINTRPIKGREKFKAYYRLKSGKPGMNDQQILKSLERIGFADFARIKTIDGSLVITYDGEISVDTGFDTHVSIEGHSTIDGSMVPDGKILPLEFMQL